MNFFGYLRDRCGLKNTDNVLDIGCGCGRMAIPLTCYLKSTALYRGFDIIDSLIARAETTIKPRFPNFDFKHVNLYNSSYNPNGNIFSSNFKFPFRNNSFDFVILTSVFTHMLPNDVFYYLSEIRRVLRPGGKCMTTCFLYNSESKQLLDSGKSTLLFNYNYENSKIKNAVIPEEAICFDQSEFFTWIERNGFRINKFFPGNWCGRTTQMNWISYQDIVLFTKPKK